MHAHTYIQVPAHTSIFTLHNLNNKQILEAEEQREARNQKQARSAVTFGKNVLRVG